MIPQHLEDWTLEVVKTLLTSDYSEAEAFDYKQDLPHKSDLKGKFRLRKTCAAFANGYGGFLIFGVADKSTGLKGVDRLIGVSSRIDFPEQFGNYPGECQPSVPWRPQNPPIQIDPNLYLPIIEIQRGWRAPYCVETDGNAFLFPKRTNKGTEFMPYSETKNMFLSFYEKRIKLQLMASELEQIRADADKLSNWNSRLNVDPRDTTSFDSSVLSSVLADTYLVLADHPALLSALQDVRRRVREISTSIENMRAEKVRFGPSAGVGGQIQDDFRANQREWARSLFESCQTASRLLGDILSR